MGFAVAYTRSSLARDDRMVLGPPLKLDYRRLPLKGLLLPSRSSRC